MKNAGGGSILFRMSTVWLQSSISRSQLTSGYFLPTVPSPNTSIRPSWVSAA